MKEFHELYIRYANDIYRFALFLCGDPSEAEEITAETFARALTGKTPIIQKTAKSYFIKIARNFYLESIRRRRNKSEVHLDHKEGAANLEENFDRKRELEDVHDYLRTFPEIDRSALLLQADGISYNEIASLLDISLSAAKVKVHRLRLKLAEWRRDRESENR